MRSSPSAAADVRKGRHRKPGLPRSRVSRPVKASVHGEALCALTSDEVAASGREVPALALPGERAPRCGDRVDAQRVGIEPAARERLTALVGIGEHVVARPFGHLDRDRVVGESGVVISSSAWPCASQVVNASRLPGTRTRRASASGNRGRASPVHHEQGVWRRSAGLRITRNRLVKPTPPVRRLVGRRIRLRGLLRETLQFAGFSYSRPKRPCITSASRDSGFSTSRRA
jgi:hypothetical protein